jgi:hypothetical protein
LKKWRKQSKEMATNIQQSRIKKFISNTKALKLENVHKFLYKTNCKWEHKIEKLVKNGEEKYCKM